MSEHAPHIALLGAFHFPAPQGSQVYVALQAQALVRAGARVTLLSYGGRPPGAWAEAFDVVQTPGWSAPHSHRAGPKLAKPVADMLLLRSLIAEHRIRGFDAVLAHNAEAAVVALLARRSLGVPVVYVAHTLLGEELPVYGPAPLAGFARGFGRGLDRRVARHVDASIALSLRAREALARWSPAPVELIPPGLEPGAPPGPGTLAKVCAAHALEAGEFALYAGNLDSYQDIDDLVSAASHAPELPIVLATHADARQLAGVRVLPGCDAETVRSLTYAAGIALCPRRTCAGFPIKLLNYMEAGRAILAREGVGGTLSHGRDAWLVAPDTGPRAFSAALRQLHADADLRSQLGAAARETLALQHSWPALATQTLDLVERARAWRQL